MYTLIFARRKTLMFLKWQLATAHIPGEAGPLILIVKLYDISGKVKVICILLAAMEKYGELRKAVENVAAIDAHCHNLVSMNSSFPFLRCFSEAEGEALSDTSNTLSFKVCSLISSSSSTMAIKKSENRLSICMLHAYMTIKADTSPTYSDFL